MSCVALNQDIHPNIFGDSKNAHFFQLLPKFITQIITPLFLFLPNPTPKDVVHKLNDPLFNSSD